MPRIDNIQPRRGTASAWTSSNPTLGLGEIGIETDTNRLKIGDGSTAWASLAYFTTDNSRSWQAKSSNYTLLVTDYGVLCDVSGGAITITLPTASSAEFLPFVIKKTDSSTNTVTVDGDGSETIDGATTQILLAQYDALAVVSDGTDWWII